MKTKTALLLLLIAILIGAAVNLPLATYFLKSRTDDKGVETLQLHDVDGIDKVWPSQTAHNTAWPAPEYWRETRSFGYRYVHVSSHLLQKEGQNGFSMQYEQIGWPLPVYEQVQMWWPWSDPAWQTNEQSDPALRLYWPGVLLNPIMLGGSAWLVFVFPFVVWITARRRIRLKRGWCEMCGYDLRGDLDTGCPECGWNRDDPKTCDE